MPEQTGFLQGRLSWEKKNVCGVIIKVGGGRETLAKHTLNRQTAAEMAASSLVFILGVKIAARKPCGVHDRSVLLNSRVKGLAGGKEGVVCVVEEK